MKVLKHPILFTVTMLLSLVSISIYFYFELKYLHICEQTTFLLNPIMLICPILTILCSSLLFFKLYKTMYNTICKLVLSLSHSVSILYLISKLAIYSADSIHEGLNFLHLAFMLIHVAIVAIILHIIAYIVIFTFDRSKLILSLSAVKNSLQGLTSLLPLRIVVPVFVCIIGLLVVVGIGSKINESVNLPTCDSQFAEQQVIAIFKSNNFEYNQLSQNEVIQVDFSNPEPISYDKNIKKYECRADVYMTSSEGFKQYYSYSDKQNMAYRKAGCRVDYSIFKANGKNEVRANYCRGTLRYKDKFSY